MKEEVSKTFRFNEKRSEEEDSEDSCVMRGTDETPQEAKQRGGGSAPAPWKAKQSETKDRTIQKHNPTLIQKGEEIWLLLSV